VPTVTLTARPPQGGYAIDPVTGVRWTTPGESHVIEDPEIETRLATLTRHGFAFTFTDGAPAPTAPAAPAAPVAPAAPTDPPTPDAAAPATASA
jgi:hypothetical protein